MEMDLAPPSYSDATRGEENSFHPVTGPAPNFCWSCGAKCGAISPEQPICKSCGVVLVQTQQPVADSKATAPVIQQPSTVDAPSSSRQSRTSNSKNYVEVNATEDMAYRQGNRLIYDFEKVACCPGQVVGLHDRVKAQLPKDLHKKGITPKQWEEWMEQLMDVQGKAPSIVGCLCLFCFPGFIAQSILCAMFCPTSMDQPLAFLPCYYGDWYRGLRGWQDKVNKVLNVKGMHAKLVTYKPHTRAPPSKLGGQRKTGKDENYEMSFLVIALTPGESAKLQSESWDHGVNDRCTSGIGRCL